MILPRWSDYSRLATLDPATGRHTIRRRSLREIEQQAESLARGSFDVLGGRFLAYAVPDDRDYAAPWRETATVWADGRAYPATRIVATVRGLAWGGIGLRRLALHLDGQPILATWYVPGRIGQRLLDVVATRIDPTSWPTEADDFDFGLHLAKVLPPIVPIA